MLSGDRNRRIPMTSRLYASWLAVVAGSVLNVVDHAGRTGSQHRDPDADAQSLRAAHANKLARLVQFAQGCNTAGKYDKPAVRAAGDRKAPRNAF